MGKINDGKQRTTQQKRNNQISHLKSEPTGVGVIPGLGGEPGDNKIGTSGKDSDERNTAFRTEWTPTGIPGKIISQLVDENQKQLAYHEQQAKYHQQQAELLKQRIEQLKQIPETLAEIEHQE